jgi:hypothetical protein
MAYLMRERNMLLWAAEALVQVEKENSRAQRRILDAASGLAFVQSQSLEAWFGLHA